MTAVRPDATLPPAAVAAPESSKVMTLAAAVRAHVRPGAHIHLAYGGGRPNAAIAEIIRQYAGRRPGFRVSAHGFVNTQHALVAAGLVDRLTVAFAGENYPSPRPNPILQRAAAAGEVRIENWSLWSLTARLMAGALGLPFLPVRSLAGSSMAAEHDGRGYLTVRASSSEPPSSAVRPLRPDVVLVQALAADPAGNVILAPPYGEGAWGALAAKSAVIACVESVVGADVLRANNQLPMIPAHAVSAVCHTPMGSHPYGIHAGSGDLPGVHGHVEDAEFMAELRTSARDVEAIRRWIDRWILGVADHAEYLDRLGSGRLADLTVRQQFTPPGDDGAGAQQPNPTEQMILATARVLRERIRVERRDVVLAGIGQAHLAAWTAVRRMQETGDPVQLAAELGMSGFIPQPGDPYLFAAGNFPTSRQLTDVLTVLGRDMAGPGTSSLAVLGAGQIDAAGNLNSTYADDGRFLVGSGGANDVATAADEVVAVVAHKPGRLVQSVGYVTAPGTHVSTIVTTAGVLRRDADRFVLATYMPDAARSREEIIRDVRAQTGWDLDVARDCAAEPTPEAADLTLLRSFDPAGIFRRP